jgi:prolyl 4-hydroxylase
MRTRLRLPVVLISCSLFFLAGFFGSLLFTQVTHPRPRSRSQ